MKKVTSQDVAKLAGVSQPTVSLVLNNSDKIKLSEITKAKVIEAAKQLEYGPFSKNRYNVSKKTNIIGVFVPNLVNPFYPLLLEHIEEHLTKANFGVMLYDTKRDSANEKQMLNLATKTNVDGMIYAFTPTASEHFIRAASQFPIVIIGESDDVLNADIVGLNSFKAGQIIAEHLVSKGHKNIAFVSTPLDHLTLSRRRRLEGIKNYLNKIGLLNLLTVLTSNNETEIYDSVFEIDNGYNLTKDLLKSDKKITAIIGVNDLTAVGICNALIENTIKIPQDIAVCGFDNTFISKSIHPTLTTVDHCLYQRAKQAVDILIERINSKPNMLTDFNYKVTYEPVLIERESS